MVATGKSRRRPKDLVDYVDRHEEELLDFVRLLVATPSHNPPGDERAVAALVSERLADLGLPDVQVVSGNEARPNVIARLNGGQPGPVLMLSGHIDTKPPGDLGAWNHDPWEPHTDGVRLTGLGVVDMKAAVAAMVYSAAALRHVGGFSGQLQLVFTADEEYGSVFGAEWLAESGLLEADVAVIGEPVGIERDWEAIDLVSRGAALFKISLRGNQMHSCLSDRFRPVSATQSMARLINRMSSGLLEHLTFTPHPIDGSGPTVNIAEVVSGGIDYGFVPGAAEFKSSVPTVPGMTRTQFEQDVIGYLEAVGAEEPDLEAEYETDMWIPPSEIPASHPIVGCLQEAGRQVLGHAPPLGVFPGATDAPHFSSTARIPTVPAFGPGLLTHAHMPNEWIDIRTIPQAAKIYALAAASYLVNDRSARSRSQSGEGP